MAENSSTLSRDVTASLNAWRQGDRQALMTVMPQIYGQLRRQASSYFQYERSDHTLQPTALVHETFLRLIEQRQGDWHSRSHFYAIAATLMRRILVDHARGRGMAKRGSGDKGKPLDEARHVKVSQTMPVEDLIAIDEALDRLSQLDPMQGRLVELRYFAGLSVEETAEVLGVTSRTVKRRWRTAKLWLYQQLTETQDHGT